MSKLPEKCSHGNPFGIGTKCPECDAIWKEHMMSSDERLLQLSFDHLGGEYQKLQDINKQLLAEREHHQRNSNEVIVMLQCEKKLLQEKNVEFRKALQKIYEQAADECTPDVASIALKLLSSTEP